MCRSVHCRNCFEFDNSKDILLNSGNIQISWYVMNFLTDNFSVSEVTKNFLNIDLKMKYKKKSHLYLRWLK